MATYDITTLGSGLEFDATQGKGMSLVKVTGLDRIAVSWMQSTTLVYVQVFSLNTSTGALTAIGSPLDVEAGTIADDNVSTELVMIDASNLMVLWSGPGTDGFAQLVSMDGTGNCTANGSSLEYDTTDGRDPAAILWDSTHVLVVWAQITAGKAVILTFNTSLGTIVVTGTVCAYSATGSLPSVAQLSSTKAIVTYGGASADGFAIVLDVAAVTYAVTAAGSAFEWLNNSSIQTNSVAVISTGSPMVVANFYANSGSGYVRTLNIDTSTWAITLFGAELDLSIGTTVTSNNANKKLFLYDSTHLVLITTGAPSGTSDGGAFTISYNSGTGALTTVSSLSFFTADCQFVRGVDMGNSLYIATYSESSTADGFLQTLQVSTGVSNAKFFPFLDRR